MQKIRNIEALRFIFAIITMFLGGVNPFSRVYFVVAI